LGTWSCSPVPSPVIWCNRSTSRPISWLQPQSPVPYCVFVCTARAPIASVDSSISVFNILLQYHNA
jgi:hypothetical protein